MFLAGKPGQKQTLLAKKGKKNVPGWKTRTKTNIAGKKGKKLFLAGKKPEHYGCWLAKKAVK